MYLKPSVILVLTVSPGPVAVCTGGVSSVTLKIKVFDDYALRAFTILSRSVIITKGLCRDIFDKVTQYTGVDISV